MHHACVFFNMHSKFTHAVQWHIEGWWIEGFFYQLHYRKPHKQSIFIFISSLDLNPSLLCLKIAFEFWKKCSIRVQLGMAHGTPHSSDRIQFNSGCLRNTYKKRFSKNVFFARTFTKMRECSRDIYVSIWFLLIENSTIFGIVISYLWEKKSRSKDKGKFFPL